jgi:hypothetical protein
MEAPAAQRALLAGVEAVAAVVAEPAVMGPSLPAVVPAATPSRLPAGPAASAALVGSVRQAMAATAASEFSLRLQLQPL